MKSLHDLFFQRLLLSLATLTVLGMLSAKSLADDQHPPVATQPASDKIQRSKPIPFRKKTSNRPTTNPATNEAERAAQLRAAKTAAEKKNPALDIPAPTVVLKPGEIPNIKFDATTFDFGRVEGGADVEHEYWFTNTGNGPLEILRVKPS